MFRSSKRSVAFLRYVVEQTLGGAADQIKERTIGVEVFGREPSYDTNLDHIVRTAATELRKRLASYYVDERHRGELRMGLLPGSYVPRFTLPGWAKAGESGVETEHGEGTRQTHSAQVKLGPIALRAEAAQKNAAPRSHVWAWTGGVVTVALATLVTFVLLHRTSPEDIFWKPVLDTPGPVLLAVGGHPNGPPTLPDSAGNGTQATPVPSSDTSGTVPFADTVTIAQITGALEARNKRVVIRLGNASSFSDLREGAVVLIGAFNNEWSLRLTKQLRYSLALDADRHLIYIEDAKNPGSRTWSWATNQSRELATGVNSPKMQDFALISRIRDAGTGHVVVVVGGLYTYGTQAAGEFLTDPELMQEIARIERLGSSRNLQIVLETTVTDGTPGPPHVVAVSVE
jgi:hypothetical protein